VTHRLLDLFVLKASGNIEITLTVTMTLAASARKGHVPVTERRFVVRTLLAHDSGTETMDIPNNDNIRGSTNVISGALLEATIAVRSL
jgi:hypothetical protein